jgi:hypothetical protein
MSVLFVTARGSDDMLARVEDRRPEHRRRHRWPARAGGPRARNRSRRCVLGVALLVALLGCDGDEPASWWFEFESPALASRAVEIEAVILQGGCSSTTSVFGDRFGVRELASTPPALDPGMYGFAGRARDADCVWFAYGCSDVLLPAAGATVWLRASTEEVEPGCEEPPDAGSDGGRHEDGGRSDGGRSDGGRSDGGRADAGPPPCTAAFGAADSFELCEETAESCRFYADTGGGSCRALCSSFGASCIAAADEDAAEGRCAVLAPIGCGADRNDSICTCSR